jgi:hypothetical protein
MLETGFEPTILLFEWAKTIYGLDRAPAASAIEVHNSSKYIIIINHMVKTLYTLLCSDWKCTKTLRVCKNIGLYSVSTKSIRGFEKLWHANKLS